MLTLAGEPTINKIVELFKGSQFFFAFSNKIKTKSAIKSVFFSFAQNNLHCSTTDWRIESACQES